MKRSQKILSQAQLDEEKKQLDELKKIFQDARDECETKISALSARRDYQNLQSIIYQKQYQDALKKQINEALVNLDKNEYNTVDEYLQDCYLNGYIGVLYDLQAQGIPLTMPIDQKKIVKAMRVDTKLSSRLYAGNPLKGTVAEDMAWLKSEIATQLAVGISTGESWNAVALKISNGMNNPFDVAYNRAVRIARTEGHRIYQSSAYDAQCDAKDRGIKVMKQWDATLDDRTRPTHQELDGQLREINEPFQSSSGLTAMYPGDFGDPAEDVNCRCQSLTRATWNLNTEFTKRDSFTKDLLSFNGTDDYEAFKKNYFSDENMEYMKYMRGLEEKYGTNLNGVLNRMNDSETERYKDLWANNPLYQGARK